MALSIQTNYANLVGQNTINQTNSDFNTSLERLTTGYRINSAADDAAGLQISNRLEAQGRGMGVAMRNAGDAISQMQVAEGALEQMTDIAYRMNDLATQSANGTASADDRSAMQSEFGALASELKSLMENTNMGGQNLLAGSDGVFSTGSISYQVGSTSDETLSVDMESSLETVGAMVESLEAAELFTTAYDASIATAVDPDSPTTAEIATANAAGVDAVDGLGPSSDGTGYFGTDFTAGDFANMAAIDAAGFDISTQAGASAAITEMTEFVDDISAARSGFGANINRLDYTMSNLASMQENTAAAKSNIMDTDMASESSAMSKNQMLMQMGTQMLSTTKMVPQLAMGLLG